MNTNPDLSKHADSSNAGHSEVVSIADLQPLVEAGMSTLKNYRDEVYEELSSEELDRVAAGLQFLDTEDRLIVIESLIAHSKNFDDAKLQEVLSKMEEEERGRVIYYLATCVDTSVYIDSFQAHFEDLWYVSPESVGLSNRESPRSRVVEKFTNEQAERAILLAPFMDIARLQISESGTVSRAPMPNPRFDRRRKNQDEDPKKPYMEVFAGTLEEASDVIERMIRHPHTKDCPQYMKSMLQYYTEKHQTALIIPYLPELVKKEIITKEEAREILQSENVYVRTALDLFMSKEMRAQLKLLEAKTREIYPEKFKDQSYIDGYEMPESFRRIYLKLQKIELQRAAEHMLQNAEELKELFSTEWMWDKFLVSMMSCGQPVFSVLPEGMCSVDDIKRILALAEQEGEEVSHSHRVEEVVALYNAGLQRRAFTMLIDVMNQDHNFSHEIMADFDKIADCLSPGRFRALVETIDRTCPALWLSNLGAMERYSSDLLKERVDKLATTDKLPFEYMKIYNYIRLHEDSGETLSITRDELKERAWQMVLRNPSLMFQEPFFSQAFPSASKSELVLKTLNEGCDKEFIKDCLYHIDRREDKKLLEAVRDTIRSVILEREEELATVLVNTCYQHLDEFFSREERLAILMRHLDSMDESEFQYCYDYQLVKDLIARPDKMKEFLHHFSQPDCDPKILEEVGDQLDSIGRSLHGDKYQKARKIDGVTESKYETSLAMYRAHVALISLRKPGLLLNDDVQYVMKLKESNPGLDRWFTPRIQEHFNGEPIKDPLGLIKEAQDLCSCTRSEAAAAFARVVLTHEADSIVSRYPLHVLSMKGIIDDSRYEALLDKHFLGLSLSPDKDGRYPLEKALEDDDERLEAFQAIEPFSQAQKLAEEMKIDFYRALQSVLARSHHYPPFQAELDRLIEHEIYEHGERREVSYYDQNREIATIARQIAALHAIDTSFDFAETLYYINSEDREQLINQLHYVVLFTPDILPELRSKLLDAESCSALLQTTISSHMKALFDLDPEKHGDVNLSNIPDAEMLRALVSYYSTTCVGNELMEGPFRDYIGKVFQGNYYSWRAWGRDTFPQTREDSEAALEKLVEEKLVPQGISLEQYVLWQSESGGTVDADVSENESQLFLECKRILKRATPLHIPEHILEGTIAGKVQEYRTFLQPLDQLVQQRNVLRERLKSGEGTEEEKRLWISEFQKAKEGVQTFLAENSKTKKQYEAAVVLQHVIHGPGPLQHGKMLIQNRWVSIEAAFSKLQEAYGARYPDFAIDLQNIEKRYRRIERIHSGKAEIAKSTLSLTDKVDMKTYFFMGERPVTSCQHYDSANGYNQGLLSTSTDPAMKVIQVYDEKGKILSRAVLRLLQDEEGEPTLLLERIYSINNHPDVYKSIYRFAATKALEMGVALYGQPGELSFADFDYDDIKNLISQASRGGYVYTDAGGGLQKKGDFIARHAIRLQASKRGASNPEREESYQPQDQ